MEIRTLAVALLLISVTSIIAASQTISINDNFDRSDVSPWYKVEGCVEYGGRTYPGSGGSLAIQGGHLVITTNSYWYNVYAKRSTSSLSNVYNVIISFYVMRPSRYARSSNFGLSFGSGKLDGEGGTCSRNYKGVGVGYDGYAKKFVVDVYGFWKREVSFELAYDKWYRVVLAIDASRNPAWVNLEVKDLATGETETLILEESSELYNVIKNNNIFIDSFVIGTSVGVHWEGGAGVYIDNLNAGAVGYTTQSRGSLTIRVHNVRGYNMPMSGGVVNVKLYVESSGGWVEVGTRSVNYQPGTRPEYVTVQFDNLELNKRYLYEVTQKPFTSLQYEEYWGNTIIALTSSATVDFYRSRPFIANVEDYPRSVSAGGQITFNVVVKNEDTRSRSLYITTILDRDLAEPLDLATDSPAFTLQPGEQRRITITVRAPSTPGVYKPYFVLKFYYPQDSSAHGTVYDQWDGREKPIEVTSQTTTPTPQRCEFRIDLGSSGSGSVSFDVARCSDVTGDGKRDAYVYITVPSGASRLQVTMSVERDDDIDMRLYDPRGSEVDKSDRPTGQNEQITVNNPASGVWKLHVYEYSIGGSTANVRVEARVEKQTTAKPLRVEVLYPVDNLQIYLRSMFAIVKVTTEDGQPVANAEVTVTLRRDGRVVNENTARTLSTGFVAVPIYLERSGSYELVIRAKKGDSQGTKAVRFEAKPISIIISIDSSKIETITEIYIKVENIEYFIGGSGLRNDYGITNFDILDFPKKWEELASVDYTYKARLEAINYIRDVMRDMNGAVRSGEIKVKVYARTRDWSCDPLEFTLRGVDKAIGKVDSINIALGLKTPGTQCKLKIDYLSPSVEYAYPENLDARARIVREGLIWSSYWIELEIKNKGIKTTIIPTLILISDESNMLKISEAKIENAPDVGGELMRTYRELGKVALGGGWPGLADTIFNTYLYWQIYGAETAIQRLSSIMARKIVEHMSVREEPYVWAPMVKKDSNFKTFAPLKPGDVLVVRFKIDNYKSIEGKSIKIVINYVEVERLVNLVEWPALEHYANFLISETGLIDRTVGIKKIEIIAGT